MGKALVAVGSFLAFCILSFGLAVYLTRDEDAIAVDNLLAERLARAVVEADQQDTPLDLRAYTPFEWDEVLIADIDAPTSTLSRELGYPFKGELLYTAESSALLVFSEEGEFVKFADYRGRGRFEGLDRPTQTLSAAEAVFEVDDGVVTPVAGA